MYFYPGNGADGFASARTTVGPGWGTFRLIPIEYNGDGKLDVLAINPADEHLYFYPGDGTGNFGSCTDRGGGWG
nr:MULTISPECIES: VCBS repeat-containing protein [unclassified Streptomyces]